MSVERRGLISKGTLAVGWLVKLGGRNEMSMLCCIEEYKTPTTMNICREVMSHAYM